VPPWQVPLLRGRALMALGEWEQAAKVLPEAMKLNPDPTEAHYLLGLVYEHEKNYADAAGEYRKAFESTAPGTVFATTRPGK